MTTEERILLLKDLSGRLPYGVKIRTYSSINNFINNCGETIDEVLTYENIVKIPFNSRPYLRPMSSMTDEEMNELKNILPFPNGDIFINCDKVQIFDISGDKSISWHCFYDVINWLNSHHFDYHNLIEKGLALEATEVMYND